MESYHNGSTTNKFTEFCSLINQTSNCMSELVFSECVPETLEFIFDNTNEYLKGFTYLTAHENNNSLSNNTFKCHLNTPTVAVQTGCQEEDVIKFLECEHIIDKFQFQPISFLRNSTHWNDFCQVTGRTYRQCHDSISCHFEPVTSATRALYSNLCDRPITRRDQHRFSDCLNDVTSSTDGQKCLEAFHTVDFLAKDVGIKICAVIQQILNCTADSITDKCGHEALLHVYDTHIGWMHAFNSSCVIHPPVQKEDTPTKKKLIEEPLRTAKIEDEKPQTTLPSSTPLVLIIGGTETTPVPTETTTTTEAETTTTVNPSTTSLPKGKIIKNLWGKNYG